MQNRKISTKELNSHNKRHDCWITLYGKVYDVSVFLEKGHPGGRDPLLECAGGDANAVFEKRGHGKEHIETLAEYQIGVYDAWTLRPEDYKTLPILSMAEIGLHNNEKSCWLLINDLVYDMTKFLMEHPGGKEKLLHYAGIEATKVFHEGGKHGHEGHNHYGAFLEKYIIGRVSTGLDFNSCLWIAGGSVITLAALYYFFKYFYR